MKLFILKSLVFFLSISLAVPICAFADASQDVDTQAQRQITGVVLDREGSAIVGAVVTVKGTSTTTISNVDGRFTLSVQSGANPVIEVSAFGHVTQDIEVGGQTDLVITMAQNEIALDDVIVIGYGTTSRKEFTGSVAQVRVENSPISLAANMNALEAIKGNVPGLDIGATNSAGGTPSMDLRGQKSISGNNSPLIVVDGVIFLGELNQINPADIASFDILKDATSASAYGSRSANGVIIITTKRGKTGKPTVSFNAAGSMQSWYNRPELMDGETWLKSVQARQGDSSDLSWLRPQEQANRDAGREIDWLEASSRTGWLQDYSVAVSGAGESSNYYVSGAYTGNQGIVIGDDYNRVSAMAKIDTDITGWLQIGVDGGFTRQDFSGASADLYQAKMMSPYGVMYYDEANKLLERYPYTQSGINPLWGVTNGSRDNLDLRHNFRLNTFALVKVPWVEGLTYRFNFAGNLDKQQLGDFYHETHYVQMGAYDAPGRYTSSAYQSLLSNASGTLDNRSTYSWVIDNIINYKRRFGLHSLDLTAVATRDRRTYDQTAVRGSDFAANGNTSLGLDGLSMGSIQSITRNGDQRSNIGYLARGSYSFDDRYFFTASYRRDGASVFGTESKWGDFYAFGGAWNITRESFMESVSFLDDFKLKLSWGKNGNQGVGPYGTLSKIMNGRTGGQRYELGNVSNILYGLQVRELGNASLGWEKTQSLNTGFESAWLNYRLFVDMDIYFSKTTDQIFTRSIPSMNGLSSVRSSLGQVNNHGVELTVRSVNIENGHDIQWGTQINFWLNRNKLIHLYGDDMNGDGREDDSIGSGHNNGYFIDEPLGTLFGYEQDGIVQASDTEYMSRNSVVAGVPKYVDQDGNGVINSEDRKILGYSSPNFRLAMSNTVSWKNLELYAMITGTFGGGGYYLRSNPGAFQINGTGLFNSNGIYIPWYTEENPSNVYPSAAFNGDGGRFLGLQSRGFVRLQDLSLSYTFRQPWVRNAGISAMKVYFSGKNLLTVTNWEGGDPEVGSGVREGSYPVISTLTLGASISF